VTERDCIESDEISRSNGTKYPESEKSRAIRRMPLRETNSWNVSFTVTRGFWDDPHRLGLGTLLRVVRWTHAALRRGIFDDRLNVEEGFATLRESSHGVGIEPQSKAGR
jgi:hypothetical protein